jgi:hypothetical protein
VNIKNSLFSKLSLTMLVAFSMVLLGANFVSYVPVAKAANVNLCIDTDSGNLMKPNSTNDCPPNFSYRENISDRMGGVCVVQDNAGDPWDITLDAPDGYQLNANGDFCTYPPDPTKKGGPFVAFNHIGTYPDNNPNGNTNNGNGNSNTGNGNTNSGGGNNNNNGGGNGGNGNFNGGGGSPQAQGDCETGFHKAGPICVPNSPFTTGIAGNTDNQTAAGLAATIIRIFLYFAGIVAVIMAIIGGYQIMTAAGNATQATNGRKTLTNALIGLGIVILSYIIIQAVINFITK